MIAGLVVSFKLLVVYVNWRDGIYQCHRYIVFCSFINRHDMGINMMEFHKKCQCLPLVYSQWLQGNHLQHIPLKIIEFPQFSLDPHEFPMKPNNIPTKSQ